VAPIPAGAEAAFEYRSLGQHNLTWSGAATKTFHTCPPRRILLIGDSIAFTLGVPLLTDEQRYGTEVADAADLGCAFGVRGELDVNGSWEPPPARCLGALGRWRAAERAFGADLVVVELGYRDEFDWRWGGRLEHVGDRAFDNYLRRRIEQYIRILGAGGTRILLLSVPFTHPPDASDGSLAPQASPARHAAINALLTRAAHAHPGRVSVVDLDRVVSPGGHYVARVDGQACRFDGIHFTVFCAKLLEPRVLTAARALLGS
jgi:hypothetical protein